MQIMHNVILLIGRGEPYIYGRAIEEKTLLVTGIDIPRQDLNNVLFILFGLSFYVYAPLAPPPPQPQLQLQEEMGWRGGGGVYGLDF